MENVILKALEERRSIRKYQPTLIEEDKLQAILRAGTYAATGMGNLMNAAYAVGVDSCWIHRAKEEFDSEEGKALLKKWGIEGDYVGVGHCILGYRDCEYPDAKPRKGNYIYRV